MLQMPWVWTYSLGVSQPKGYEYETMEEKEGTEEEVKKEMEGNRGVCGRGE